MKTEKIKRGIVIVLLLVVVFIWAKNINLFKSEPDYYRLTTEKKAPPKTGKTRLDSLEYRKPVINPFADQELLSAQKKAGSATSKPPKPPEKLPSEIYLLEGIVSGTDRPQAVLRNESGGSILISTADSLDGWKVRSVSSKSVILARGSKRDTLRLEKD